MPEQSLNIVTGAFGYTGRHIAARLLAKGARVRTITRRPGPAGSRIEAAPMSFDDPDALRRSLEGASTLYNTYWIRFEKGPVTFQAAVENTKILVKAAESAGVERIVHVSITNASADSPLPYFKGKGFVEQAIRDSRLSYAIIRPTLVFGSEDVLLNNIAWAIRRFPIFPIFGDGAYPVQPVFVGDVADIAVNAGAGSGNAVLDAVGPDEYSFEELARLVALFMGRRPKVLHVSPRIGFALTKLVGYAVRDVVLTRSEIDGLMAGLLVSRSEPAGATRLSEWLAENAKTLGRSYVSELRRNYRGGRYMK